jgi:hypothetical protein
MESPDTSAYKLTEKRIALLTLVIGALGAIAGALVSSVRMGAGILVGAVAAWVSFRWLESALDSLTNVLIAQGGAAEARVPKGAIAKIAGRYLLMGGIVYVTFSFFQIPVVSMLLGLCALGAATIVASLYEILHPVN